MILKTDAEAIAPYCRDASNFSCTTDVHTVAIPSSTEEVALFLARCSAQDIPVHIAGSGTGLCGGRVPTTGGAILSTERLLSVWDWNLLDRTVRVQPGVVLKDLLARAAQHGMLYPPDPTEKSSSLGGNIATNASGARTFHYGPTRRWVNELTVALADGDVLHMRRGDTPVSDDLLWQATTAGGRHLQVQLPQIAMPNHKHAAGYYIRPGMDALDLFIGSEGTLGVITEATLQLLPLPHSVFSGVVFFPSAESLMAAVDEARSRSEQERAAPGTDICARALEFFDSDALALIRHEWSHIPEAARCSLWFEQECQGEDNTHLLEQWYMLFERHGALTDSSWFGESDRDHERFRAFRHAVPSKIYESLGERGKSKIGTDMAVAPPHFPMLYNLYRSSLQHSGLLTATFGHIGDCHLHVNMLPEGQEQQELSRRLYDSFIEATLSAGGTVSAEHGIGKLKKKYLQAMYGTAVLEEFNRIKKYFDPRGILSPLTMI